MSVSPFLTIKGYTFKLGKYNGLYYTYTFELFPKRVFICRYHDKTNEFELLFRLKNDVVSIGWGNTIQEIEKAWNRWYMDIKPKPRRKRNKEHETN